MYYNTIFFLPAFFSRSTFPVLYFSSIFGCSCSLLLIVACSNYNCLEKNAHTHTHKTNCVHKHTAMLVYFSTLLLGYAYCIRFETYFREYKMCALHFRMCPTAERTFIILAIAKFTDESANIRNRMSVDSSILLFVHKHK